jgi:hypothetical protein
LVQYRQPHREVKPIHNVFSLWTHVELGSRTVSLPSERKVICWFICIPWDLSTSNNRRFDLVSSVWTKPKRLLEGWSSSSSRWKARVLLPTMTAIPGQRPTQATAIPAHRLAINSFDVNGAVWSSVLA